MVLDGYPKELILTALLIGLVFCGAIGLLIQWLRMRRAPDGPEEPDPAQMPAAVKEEPPPEPGAREIFQRFEDILAARLGHQTEIALDAESRVKSELREQALRLELLSEAVRQNGKELAAVDQLLRDIVQILNISISETKGLSQKVQRHLDEPGRVFQPAAGHANPARPVR